MVAWCWRREEEERSSAASFLCSDGLSRGPLQQAVSVQLWLTVAGLGAGAAVCHREAAGLQQRVCGWWRGGVGPWVRGGHRRRATVWVGEVLNLLVELVAFHFQRPPQLLKPLDFALKCLKLSVPHRFLETNSDANVM